MKKNSLKTLNADINPTNDNKFSWFDLPELVREHIFSFTDNSKDNLVSMLHTCKQFHSFFKQKGADDEIAFQTLLQAIADKETATVIKILTSKPELLIKQPQANQMIKSRLTGQEVKAEKPLEFARINKNYIMMKTIIPFFEKIPNSEREFVKQATDYVDFSENVSIKLIMDSIIESINRQAQKQERAESNYPLRP